MKPNHELYLLSGVRILKTKIRKMILLFCTVILMTGCSNQFVDKTLKVEPFTVSEEKIKDKVIDKNTQLTGTYSEISDMYSDSDYIVFGTVKSISYFEDNCILLRKIDVLVDKSYKGSISKNTLISVLEKDGYARLKSMYEEAKKHYEERNGDKEKEEEFCLSAAHMSDINDINNDMLVKYKYTNKVDSRIDDNLLLFLTDSSDDTYKDKKVKLFDGKLIYPEGAYVPLGLFMGKLTVEDDYYHRCGTYNTTIITEEESYVNKPQRITSMYAVKDMKDILKNLEINK